MLDRGLWVAIEGSDGVGKSTAISLVAASLAGSVPDLEVLRTRHPGTTPLGHWLRKLIKEPASIDPAIRLDALSEQLLMVVDHINFKLTVLEPAIDRGAVVLADRCDLIGGLVYGTATGIHPLQINALFTLAAKPRLDRLYVLTCPDEIIRTRLAARGSFPDRFERLSGVADIYRTLLTGPPDRLALLSRVVALDNVVYVDSSTSPDQVARTISADIATLIGR